MNLISFRLSLIFAAVGVALMSAPSWAGAGRAVSAPGGSPPGVSPSVRSFIVYADRRVHGPPDTSAPFFIFPAPDPKHPGATPIEGPGKTGRSFMGPRPYQGHTYEDILGPYPTGKDAIVGYGRAFLLPYPLPPVGNTPPPMMLKVTAEMRPPEEDSEAGISRASAVTLVNPGEFLGIKGLAASSPMAVATVHPVGPTTQMAQATTRPAPATVRLAAAISAEDARHARSNLPRVASR